MKKLTLPLAALLLAMSSPAYAVSIGATYEQVVSEKGTPPGQMKAGGTQILNYPDQTIKLKGGKVTEVSKPPGQGMVVPEAPKVPRARSVESGEGEARWTTDYRAALGQAKEQNRQVFLFFTGSDWCGWCKKLEAEILGTPAFRGYARDNLILVKLDFPHALPQSTEVKSQNAALARKFRVEGYPTVIVLDRNGREVKQLGYQPGGPGPFVDVLRSVKS